MTRLRGIIAPFLLLLLVSTAAFAQSVRGKVVDPDKRPVADAKVLILHGDAVVASTTTDNDGEFGPVTVSPGDYEVTAAAPGLGTPAKSVSVKAGAPTDVDLALALSAVQESVVVSGAQGEVPLSRTTESVTVIERAQLDLAQTHSVADALRSVPGFHVVTSGTIGALTSMFPRGGESDYTLVLINGVPQNGFGGAFDVAHLDTAGLDRIEVIRGPKSALYGNGAIGGVVHLVSRQGGPSRGQFAIEGGGYGFMRTTGSANGSHGAFRWGGSVDRLESDGDTREFAGIGKVSNNDYERTTASGSFGWSDRPSRSIRVDVQGGKNIKGFPGPYGSDPDHLYGGLDLISRGTNTTNSLGVSGAFGNATRGRHSMQFTSFDFKSHYVSPPYGCDPTTCTEQPSVADDESQRITGRYQFDREMQKVGISAGWELLREQVDNTYITGPVCQNFTCKPIPVTRNVSGLFVEGRPVFGNNIELAAGARFERIARSAIEASPGAHPDLPDDVIWSFNPKISAAFFVNKDAANWTKIRASAGTGIKPPTGFELAYTDNPSLKPERSRSMDAGVEQAFGAAFAVDATYFFNQFDDLIVSVGKAVQGASKYKTDNIANAHASGLELGAQWRHRSGLGIRAGYTALHTEVLGLDQFPDAAPNPYKVGEPLVRRPSHLAFADVTWTDARCNLFLSINGRGSMPDLEPTYASRVVTNPGFSTTSLGGSVHVGQYLEVFGRVSNLFDKSYEEVFGFPSMGRTASIGVRIAAGR